MQAPLAAMDDRQPPIVHSSQLRFHYPYYEAD
jgi:hypothetical protein